MSKHANPQCQTNKSHYNTFTVHLPVARLRRVCGLETELAADTSPPAQLSVVPEAATALLASIVDLQSGDVLAWPFSKEWSGSPSVGQKSGYSGGIQKMNK